MNILCIKWLLKRHFLKSSTFYNLLGLETIHLLTLRKNYELRVDMEDFNGAKVHASYTSFSISPQAINAEVDGYRLHVSGFTNGGAGELNS